jgi:cobalamin biosynthesis protein CobD/CbiB
VRDALNQGDLKLTRTRLGMIVSRNDGMVPPLFYLALDGQVWGVVYKAVNTLH